MNQLDADTIHKHAREKWQVILSNLGIAVSTNPKQHGPCPKCGGKDRFRFDDKDGRGTWYCNQCEPHSGDGLQLVRNIRGCSFREALELVAGVLGIAALDTRKEATPKAKTRPTPPEGILGQTLFRYEDAFSHPLLFVKRFDSPDGGKRFEQWGPTADGRGWQNNAVHVPKPRPLYRLPQILASLADERIVIHEGEKSVHAAIRAGLPGIHISTVGGSTNPKQTDFYPLNGRDLVIVPDYDEPGEGYVQTVARLATEAGARAVCILRLPGLPAKGDVVEWLDAGGTPGQFAELIAQTEAWSSAQSPDVMVPTDTGRDEDCGLTKSLADQIQRDSFFAKDEGNRLYVFDNGVYRPTGEEFVRRRVKQILIASGHTKKWSTHQASEVVEFVRVDVPELWERPSLDTINVLNGLLDWKTGELRPHDHHHLSLVQIPVTYDPSATCQNWDRFVQEVFSADCCVLAYEIIGWLMIPDMSLQKAILLIGEGANGKSVYLSAVTAFLGRDNTASLSLQRLEGDKFAASRLVGKLANICADLPSDHLVSTSIFKAVVGGDYLLGERKFQGSFEFMPCCRLVFSTNSYPQSKDSSAAFFRRWVVIQFERTFAPSEQLSRAVLDAQLADPSALSGVLNRALDALRALQTRGGFTQSETTSAAAMEFVSMTDPVGAWLDRCTDAEPTGMVSKKDLTIVYNAAAEATGRPAMSAKAFCSAVRRLRPTIQEAQRTICGILQAVFLGLRLKDATSQNRMGRGTDGSLLSRDSRHSSQIRFEEEGAREREEEEEGIKTGNAVNDVNADLFTEEVVNDDH